MTGDDRRSRETARRRTHGPTTLQVAIFWIVIGAVAFLLLKDRLRERTPIATSLVTRQVTTVSRPVVAEPARPATPRDVAPPPEAGTSALAAPIYRCGDHYSHDPCSNARVVEPPAATGFDSRPSQKLAQLVADGRAADANTPSSVVTTTTTTMSGGRSECPGLANEVDAIDRTARQPQDRWTQDRLRTRRQWARDRQAALHC